MIRERWVAVAVLLLDLVLVAGCPSRCGSRPPAARETLPLPVNAITVPLVRQKVNYSCGDVAALAILRYWDPVDYATVSEADLYAPLHTTAKDGTDPQPIVAYLGTIPGLSAELRLHVALADLTGAIDRGEPAIVDFQAWKDEPRAPSEKEWAADWDDGHYAVLVGYDARELYFMDPSTSDTYAYVPREEFVARWHDVLTGSNERIEHAAIFVHASGRSAARGGEARAATPLL